MLNNEFIKNNNMYDTSLTILLNSLKKEWLDLEMGLCIAG